MKYISHSFRHAEVILNEPDFVNQYREIQKVIKNITDNDLIKKYESYKDSSGIVLQKSLSRAINDLLKERFKLEGWNSESAIFQDNDYQDDRWRLDFAKKDISIEVAFNHGEAIAWNLTKPVLASELNHVRKEIQTKIGVIITATQALKEAGGFDSAVGTYEKFLNYLPPLQNLLTTPLLIIGLLPPDSFRLAHIKRNGKNYGVIKKKR